MKSFDQGSGLYSPVSQPAGRSLPPYPRLDGIDRRDPLQRLLCNRGTVRLGDLIELPPRMGEVGVVIDLAVHDLDLAAEPVSSPPPLEATPRPLTAVELLTTPDPAPADPEQLAFDDGIARRDAAHLDATVSTPRGLARGRDAS